MELAAGLEDDWSQFLRDEWRALLTNREDARDLPKLICCSASPSQPLAET
jgi:hypothetical protein